MEEDLPRSKGSALEQVARLYKAKTGVECDDFHPKVLLDLTRERREELVAFLEKVEQSGRWMGMPRMDEMEELSEQVERLKCQAGEEDKGAVALFLDLAKAFERFSLPVFWA